MTALAHLMIGRAVEEAEAQKIVYDAAFGYVLAQLNDVGQPSIS